MGKRSGALGLLQLDAVAASELVVALRVVAARQHCQAEGFANIGGSIRTRRYWRKTARHRTTIEAEATQVEPPDRSRGVGLEL